jgi:phosphopantetheine--protein transferase-like protein
MDREDLIKYLSRITRAQVDSGSPINLSSAQQGAVVAWLRKNWPDPDAASRVGPRIKVDELVGGVTATVPARLPGTQDKTSAPFASGAAKVKGVGVDIASLDSIPSSEDYRTEQFFLDNFTTAEIVYCIGRPEPRLSFAGLWAAKEAIAKACQIDAKPGSFVGIEIRHDASGRPFCEHGAISISHDDKAAVAICIALPEAPASLPSDVSDPGMIPAADVEPVRRSPMRLMLALATSIAVNAVLVLALYRR